MSDAAEKHDKHTRIFELNFLFVAFLLANLKIYF